MGKALPPLSPFLKATVREKDWWVAEWKNMGLAALSWWRWWWGREGSEEALSREILFLELQKCHLEKLFLFQERAQSIPPPDLLHPNGWKRMEEEKTYLFPHPISVPQKAL